MKNKGIVFFLIMLAVVIVTFIVSDFLSKRPDKSKANPFQYDIEEFKNVDPDIIHFKEIKNFKIGFNEPAGIAIGEGKICLVGDKTLKIIDFEGNLLNETTLSDIPRTVEISENKIYVAFEKQILVYDLEGTLIKNWSLPDENSYITAIAVKNNDVFVADAGMRKVIRFTGEGEKLIEFEGKTGDDVLHGFIIPSPYFDIDINEDGELWVVNPGMHSLENYTFDGKLRTFWENTTMRTEGFSGCCNPAHFAFLADGSFVTSEKGLVRVKIYKPSGEFSGVVAAPNIFRDEGEAPDVAVDSTGNIYVLDFDKKIVRVFEPKKK